MIIPALVRLYDRLEAQGDEAVAPKGYSTQKVGFCIVLNKNGTLSQAGIVREFVTVSRDVPKKVKGKVEVTIKNEERTKSLILPGQSKPSGSGLNPCFLWDNSAYLLGFKPDDPKPERTKKEFEAFRERHLLVRKEVNDDGFDAVCRFLESWKPSDAKSMMDLAEIATHFGVFRLRQHEEYVHERDAVREWWRDHGDSWARGAKMSSHTPHLVAASLVDGRPQPCAVLHEPKIKGVGPPAGALLVSFNHPAFRSYGKEQGANAPVGLEDTFKYCTAINQLTANPRHRVRLGGDTIIFWSERASPAEHIAHGFFSPEFAALDMAAEAKAIYERIRLGLPPPAMPHAHSPLYILTLSPVEGRLSVRNWIASTEVDLVHRCREHFERATMCFTARRESTPEDEFRTETLALAPTLRQVIQATARHVSGQALEETIDPTLAAASFRSFLLGTPLPSRTLSHCVNRVRAELEIGPVRAGAIRACLVSQGDTHMDAYLNKSHPAKPYHCGRLLAVLGLAQRVAQGRDDSNLIRRHLGGAMSNPAVNIPRLQRNAEVAYFPKLIGNIGEFVRDEVKAICSRLQDDWPASLAPREQGQFLLGFYQEECWLDEAAEFKNKEFGTLRRLRTDRGEWVRSTGEQLLANVLNKRRVPYVYEVRAILSAGHERWPDFFVAGTQPPNDIYIEYLGVTHSPAYDSRWSLKLEAYKAAGITPEGAARGRLVVLDFRNRKPSETDLHRELDPYFMIESSDSV